MPIKNRIKETQNMSLHQHNPYIVGMQGSLITKTPGEAVVQALAEDPAAASLNKEYMTAFYLPVDLQFLDVTNPLVIPLILRTLAGIHSTYTEFGSYYEKKIDRAHEDQVFDKLRCLMSNYRHQKAMDSINRDSDIVFQKMKESMTAEQQAEQEKEAALAASRAQALAESRAAAEIETTDFLKTWTCKCNRVSLHHYDAVHVIFTHTHKKYPNENFYLFTNRDQVETNKKYMYLYCGRMEDCCAVLTQTMPALSSEDQVISLKLKEAMDEVYEKTKPDQDGVSYYECLYETDNGYWHDSAQRILRETNIKETTGFTAMNKFVHAIAKRLFKVDYESDKNFKYNYEPNSHKFEMEDEFHVIVRLERGKLLIFFCSIQHEPDNCIPCTQKQAVGLSIVSKQSPRPSSANSSSSHVRVYAGNYQQARPDLAADAAVGRRHVANLRGLAGRRHPHPNYKDVPGYEV